MPLPWLRHPPHPKVPALKTIYRTTADPKYDTIYQWMTKSLAVLQPDYGIHVAASAGGPTTQPTVAPTTAPVTPATPATPAK